MDNFEEKLLETRNKGNSKTPVTDNSATVSDYDGAATAIDSTSSSPPPLPSPEVSPFQVGEKVITFHWDQPYAARIQRAEFAMEQWKYFLHYPGWNKSWDEWLGPEQLLKFTNENMQMLQEVCKKVDMNMNETAQCGPQTRPKISRGPHGKKRKSNDVQKDKGVLPSEKLFLIPIPHQLKKQLVDDCELIMHLGKLVLLPRSPTVDGLLSQYSDYRLQKDGMISDSLTEILSGLQRYFDKALYALLLYKNEREQYQKVNKDGVYPSFVYGAEHLLRLFVKLPEMLRHANIEEETVAVLRQELQDFLRFLLKNQSSFFSATYEDAKGC